AVRTRTTPPDLQRFERVRERIVHGRTLITAMGHAVVAFRVATDAVVVPVGVFDQLAERVHIAFVNQQVTGLLPAEYVAARHAPGGALISLVAAHEIQEQARLRQRPFAAFLLFA